MVAVGEGHLGILKTLVAANANLDLTNMVRPTAAAPRATAPRRRCRREGWRAPPEPRPHKTVELGRFIAVAWPRPFGKCRSACSAVGNFVFPCFVIVCANAMSRKHHYCRGW